ncbi:hypothetical protein [Haloarchaeobius iranensis]|uniref:Uncharacterized protein n=1 Tax=Haloarchaeobius iranensis TaxID=996166 RepID=A0A1G9SCS6_9EURY|nr:hypothetical protein [Haloarchaeobius iranensis]SDM33120.1 hypothetical protein SAMN05192554_10191 [Haloarchaeobius iranensis]
MDASSRTQVARGGLSLLLAGAIVGLVAASGIQNATGLAVTLVVVGALALVVGKAAEQQVLLGVWLAPVVAGVIVYVFEPDALLTQAFLLGVVGIAQLLFSQTGT